MCYHHMVSPTALRVRCPAADDTGKQARQQGTHVPQGPGSYLGTRRYGFFAALVCVRLTV